MVQVWSAPSTYSLQAYLKNLRSDIYFDHFTFSFLVSALLSSSQTGYQIIDLRNDLLFLLVCISPGEGGACSKELQGIGETILFRSLYFRTVTQLQVFAHRFPSTVLLEREIDPNAKDNTVEVPL